MAVSYVWPATLPQKPTSSGYAESRGIRAVVSPMDLGPEKLRSRGVNNMPFTVAFLMNDAQLSTLETFVLTTLSGVARFGFPSPLGGLQIEVRITPDSSGKLYEAAYLGPNLHRVTMQLRELP